MIVGYELLDGFCLTHFMSKMSLIANDIEV